MSRRTCASSCSTASTNERLLQLTQLNHEPSLAKMQLSCLLHRRWQCLNARPCSAAHSVCCRAVSPLPVAACSCSYAAQAAMVSSHTCLGVLLSCTQPLPHPTFPSGSGAAWLHAASHSAMIGFGGCSATVGAACSPSGPDLVRLLCSSFCRRMQQVQSQQLVGALQQAIGRV